MQHTKYTRLQNETDGLQLCHFILLSSCIMLQKKVQLAASFTGLAVLSRYEKVRNL